MTKDRIKKIAWIGAAVFIALQAYFVREILAAELIFGLLFAVLAVIVLGVYLLAQVSESGLAWAKPAFAWLAQSARRGYVFAEALSRKPFRHLRSESAR